MPAPPWCKRRRRFGSLWWHLLSPQAESRPLAPTASGAAASICRQHTGRMHGCLRPYLRARLLHASSRRAYCTHRERLLRPCLYLCCAVACDATGPTSWGWCSATSTALSRPWRSLRPLRLRPHGRRCMPRKIRAPASVPSLWSQWRAKASGTWPLPARPVNSFAPLLPPPAPVPIPSRPHYRRARCHHTGSDDAAIPPLNRHSHPSTATSPCTPRLTTPPIPLQHCVSSCLTPPPSPLPRPDCLPAAPSAPRSSRPRPARPAALLPGWRRSKARPWRIKGRAPPRVAGSVRLKGRGRPEARRGC